MVRNNVSEFSSAIFYLEQHEKQKDFPTWVIRHQKEVFLLAYQMGEMLGFKNEELTDLAIAARFHDIGKAYIDPQIINNKGILTDTQKFEIFEHVHQSYHILKKKGVNAKPILDGVFYHHENYDGTGYPDKLSADEIPLYAQILRIVDSFSAMLGRRPYQERSEKDLDWAINQIEQDEGRHYNPKLTAVFIKIIEKIKSENAASKDNKGLYKLLFEKTKSFEPVF